MPRLVMRMKFLDYLVCGLALAGLSACNQQSQNARATVATTEVQPVPPMGSDITEQPQKTAEKLKPAKPQKTTKTEKTVKAEKTALPAKPELPAQPVNKESPAPNPGQSEITAAPELLKTPNAIRLKPLGKRVSQVPMKGMYVALTFDDGPHPSLTPRVLDILKRHGAKGTFFMLGQNAARYKSVVSRAASEGHELGVHTWSHIKMNSSSRARVDSEVSRTQNTLASISGSVPRVMRPPYGATNKTLVNHMYDRYGMASILWDVDTLDWRKPGVGKVINTAVNKARPGSIILVHDIHASTIDALDGIVTGLQARGFKLVTVSELMKIGKQEASAASQPAEPVSPVAPVPAPASETNSSTVESPNLLPSETQGSDVQQSIEVAPVEADPAEQPALTPSAQQQPQPEPPTASNAEPAIELQTIDMGNI